MIQFIKDNKIIFHPNIDLEATGKNIKYLREEKGLSVKKLADILEFETVQGIYRWQEGKTLPALENLLLLSRLFNKPINEILIIKEH